MKKGFTLIEMLVVLAIIAVVLTITGIIIVNIMSSAKQKTFELSAASLLTAGQNYYNGEYLNIAKPTTGTGLVITTGTLISAGYLEDANDLENSVVVLYNDSGNYELYVFASNEEYYVSGCTKELIKTHVIEGSIDFETVLNGVTAFSVAGDGHLQYS